MRKMTSAGISLSLAAAMMLALPASQGIAQELSERSVKTLMAYAWAYTPDKFTPPNGKAIIIDKKAPKKMMVPVAKAREVIKVGRLTAHAQICDLREDQVMNYRSLMVRERKSKKWTPQQIVYINQLHLTTVMMLVGKLQIVKNEKDGDKKVVVKEGKAAAKTCTAEQRKKVKELITAYVSSGPALASAATKAVKSQ